MQFRLVLEGKTDKKIPKSSESLKKFLANNFILSDAEVNTCEPSVEQRRYRRLTFVENNISNLPKVPRAKFLKCDGLFRLINICKFDSFKNAFATITSLSELYFTFRNFSEIFGFSARNLQ